MINTFYLFYSLSIYVCVLSFLHKSSILLWLGKMSRKRFTLFQFSEFLAFHATDANAFLMLIQDEYRNYEKSWNLESLVNNYSIDSDYYPKRLKPSDLLAYCAWQLHYILLLKHYFLLYSSIACWDISLAWWYSEVTQKNTHNQPANTSRNI